MIQFIRDIADLFSSNYVEPVTNVRQPRLVGKRKNSTTEDYVVG